MVDGLADVSAPAGPVAEPAPNAVVAAVAKFVGTGAYTGYAPVASGTFGTLPGVLVALALAPLYPRSLAGYLLALAAVIAIAIWSAHLCGEIFQSKDPSRVVSDEIAGFCVTVAFFYPLTPGLLIAAFFAFRLFDVIKPPPARQAESLPGGVGIVTDDLLAGVYANLLLRVLIAAGLIPGA